MLLRSSTIACSRDKAPLPIDDNVSDKLICSLESRYAYLLIRLAIGAALNRRTQLQVRRTAPSHRPPRPPTQPLHRCIIISTLISHHSLLPSSKYGRYQFSFETPQEEGTAHPKMTSTDSSTPTIDFTQLHSTRHALNHVSSSNVGEPFHNEFRIAASSTVFHLHFTAPRPEHEGRYHPTSFYALDQPRYVFFLSLSVENRY